MSTYAGIKAELRNFKEAIAALSNAVAIREHQFGEADVHVAPYLAQLGDLMISGEEPAEGIARLSKAREIFAAQYGEAYEGVARVTRSIAHAHGKMGNLELMNMALSNALDIALKIFDENDHRIVLLRSDLAVAALLSRNTAGHVRYRVRPFAQNYVSLEPLFSICLSMGP